jgi:hypothetical protein
VLASILLVAPKAYASLTIGSTSIASDSNLTLQPASNVGIGNANPQALLHVGTAGSRAGIIKLDGLTSGTVTIQPAAAAGAWTLTLPSTGGTNGQVLTTNGAGVTSWATVAGGGGGVTCSGCTNGYIPVWNGTALVNSEIIDTGNSINVRELGGVISIGADVGGGGSNGTVIYIDDSSQSITASALTIRLGNALSSEADGTISLAPNYSDKIVIDTVNSSIKAQTTGTFCAGDCDGNGSNKKFLFNDASTRFVIGADGGTEADGIEVKFPSGFPVIKIGSLVSGNNTVITVDDPNQQISLSADLGIRFLTPGVKPSCDISHRGVWFTTEGNSGVADKTEQCMKKSDDSYLWVAVVAAP